MGIEMHHGELDSLCMVIEGKRSMMKAFCAYRDHFQLKGTLGCGYHLKSQGRENLYNNPTWNKAAVDPINMRVESKKKNIRFFFYKNIKIKYN